MRRVIEWFLAVLAAGMCLLGVGLIAREQARTMSAPGDTGWPLPGLILLEIVLCGLVGLGGVMVQRWPGEPRWHSAPWVAAGALAALGLIGWFGFSVIVFALVPALLFGLAALSATSRRGEVAVGLGTLVLSAGVNAVAVVGLIAWSRTLNAAPVAPTATAATSSPASFRSVFAHLVAPLPPGWAAAEGPESLAGSLTGLVAFNSWGQAGFWAPEITSGNSSEYSVSTVLKQMPAGGAYIVLVEQSGGPAPIPEFYGPEYQPTDLSGLWGGKDCRSAAGGPKEQAFNKWGRSLYLEVYCQPNASDATVAAVNQLLAGWRFDRVPAGDVGWAVVTARGLLPKAVEPNKFPIIADRLVGNGPEQTIQSDDNVQRITQVQAKDESLVVTFTYRWGNPLRADTTAGNSHSWQYEARPDGVVVMTGDSGDPLPSS